MRAAMDGSDPKTLKSGVGRSSGLTIDHKTKVMYWTSARPGIEMANLDGSGVRTLISTDVGKPSSLAFFEVSL